MNNCDERETPSFWLALGFLIVALGYSGLFIFFIVELFRAITS